MTCPRGLRPGRLLTTGLCIVGFGAWGLAAVLVAHDVVRSPCFAWMPWFAVLFPVLGAIGVATAYGWARLLDETRVDEEGARPWRGPAPR